MAKPKQVRKQNEIMAEYASVCASIGQAEYRLKYGIPAELQELYARATKLNLEAAEAKEIKIDG